MGSLKVKSTSIKPRPKKKADIHIPREIYKNNSNIELFIDLVYINGVASLMSTYIKVKYRSIIHIKPQNEKVIVKCLEKSFAGMINQDSPSLSFVHKMNLNR